jgi:hypothetical protein
MCYRDPSVFFLYIVCGTSEHLYYCYSRFRDAICRNVGVYSVLEERLFAWA